MGKEIDKGKELIKGIIYALFDEKAGPKPIVWSPENLPENVRDLISLKTINILAGQAGDIPESLAVIPFPSVNLKGLVKFLEIKEVSRRGRTIDGSITVLFDEADDLIFYKYMKNFEKICGTTAKTVTKLEEEKAEHQKVAKEIDKFQENMRHILHELHDTELKAQRTTAAFPKGPEDMVDFNYKIIVVGDPHVGKTSTVLRFTDEAFRRTYIPTMGVNLSKKNVKHEGAHIKFVLWDVAGQSKFQMMRRQFYKGSDGEILVFDLTDPNSFNDLHKWYEDIKTYLKTNLRGLILANKNDLKDERKVKREDIEKLAKELNMDFFETSALTGENVTEAFIKMADLIHTTGKRIHKQE
ncbi:MAG: GTP-binding protein [Candidatus Helarchaeota archaeon]|nr:GTP-binding protein [Candidatus Helarchaeota archaeon]